MKHTVKIFAPILAAALLLAACNRAPIPPIPEETDAETTGVPDTTGTPETAAPETKVAETTAPVTTAPVTTKEPETTTPVTTPAVTTEPVTIQTPETTAAETTPVKTHQLESPTAKAETYKPFPDEYASGVIEPFYRIDETRVGVRGFEEIVLSTEGQYVNLPEQRLQFVEIINDLAAVRYFTLTEMPALNERPQSFPLVAGDQTLAFSENCVIRYGVETQAIVYTDALDPNIPHVSVPTRWTARLEFMPISRSEDGKTVITAVWEKSVVSYFDSFRVMQYKLDEELRYIEGYTLLSAIGDCDVETYGFNGAYGFLAICVARSQDENGNTVKHYAFLATGDGGESWVIYDPQTPGTPEIELERVVNLSDF